MALLYVQLQERKLLLTLLYEICGIYGVFWFSVCINTQFGLAYQIIIPDIRAKSVIDFAIVLIIVIPLFLCCLH
jgi:hypothetical protein